MVTNGLPAIHPGDFLVEILEELGTSQAAFARAIGVSPMRISHVISGSRPVTAELVERFRSSNHNVVIPGRDRWPKAEGREPGIQ
jgi:addiction module HigA family antidote